jgi:non-specific serine/threonine protein kinase
LTQRELSIAVGYSEAHISRLEQNLRPPDLATLAALFIPALYLENEPEVAVRLMELAAAARGESLPPTGSLTITRSVAQEVTETIETVEEFPPNNLPLQLTSFIGREAEIVELKRLLQGVRLVTLTGAGGSGKTRLALQVAVEALALFPDGVWFIDLTPLTDPAFVLQTVASILNVQAVQSDSLLIALTNYTRDKTLLLVLDNCEHVIETSAHLAETLLRASPQLKVLATSRERLNLSGETVYQVPPLSTPDLHYLPPVEMLTQYEAARLFVERAGTAWPDFTLTSNNALAVAQVCHHLDGIPLAIELAAARVRLLRVEEITARLSDRFRLLTGGSRTALPRHQTLRALIDWSWELLSEPERVLLRRLSVFAGGWTLEAAEALASEPLSMNDQPFMTGHFSTIAENILDLLTHLVNKSLALSERKPGVAARYRLLETIREFANEKLGAVGETTVVRQRHFHFFYALAQQAKVFGSEKGIWMNRLEAEHDNLRAALSWWLADDPAGVLPPLVERAERALQMLIPLLDFYWHRGYVVEAREWLGKLLAVDMPPSPVRAMGFQKAGWLARASGNLEMSVALLNQAFEIAQAIRDKDRVAWSLLDLGVTTRDQGYHAQAISYLSEALSLFQEIEDSRGLGDTLYSLAETHLVNGDLEAARPLCEQGLDLFRQKGDHSHIGWGLEDLGMLAFLERQLEQANALHKESLKHKAKVLDKLGLAFSFEGLAQVAAAQEQPERAAILWGAAEQLRHLLGIPLEPSRRSLYTSLIPTAREQLGAEAFAAAWTEGQIMTLEQATAYALAVSGALG